MEHNINDLSPYVRILRRWWWLLLACTVVAGASSYIGTRQMARIYQATTTVMVGQTMQMANPSGTDIYISQRDLDKAIGNWERATYLTPGLIPIHAKLATAYERTGANKKAIREYLTLAFNFQRMNDTEKAIQAVQRALRLERDARERAGQRHRRAGLVDDLDAGGLDTERAHPFGARAIGSHAQSVPDQHAPVGDPTVTR